MSKTRIIFFLILMTITVFLLSGAKEKTFPKKGEKVRNVFLMQFDVNPVKYVSLKTKLIPKYKAVIFSFFNSSCENCSKEIPALHKIYEKYKERGVYLFLIATEPVDSANGETWAKDGSVRLRSVISNWGITAPVLDDHYAMAAKTYAVQRGGAIRVPATFIVSKDMIYHYAHEGFEGEKTISEIKSVLDSLTKSE